MSESLRARRADAAAPAQLERFGELRRCDACGGVLEPEQPCAECGTVRVPPHEEWPTLRKMWVCSQVMLGRFHPWRSEQATWEHTAADAIRMAGGQHANPYGSHITNSTPLVELLPLIDEQAARWKAAGYPIDLTRRVLPAPTTADEQ